MSLVFSVPSPHTHRSHIAVLSAAAQAGESDQFLVVFDAFGQPSLEQLIRDGCVMGTAKEIQEQREKAAAREAAMEKSIRSMIDISAPPKK
jgi:hypothetical protein